MPRTASAELISCIDEFGELDRQVMAFRPTLRRREELGKKLQRMIEGPDDKSVTVHGNVYDLIASPREIRHSIADMGKLFHAAGQKAFLENCAFPLSNLAKLAIDTSGILSEDRIGPRRLDPVLRESATARRIVKPNARVRSAKTVVA